VTSGGWGSGRRRDAEADGKAEGDGLVAGDDAAAWGGVSPAAGVGTPGAGEEEVDGLQARVAARMGIARKASRSFAAQSPSGEH
jgi:hypothetical protein